SCCPFRLSPLFSPSPRLSTSSVFFFFFQAEDGIRDRNVTGVQTCALPISAVLSCPNYLPFTVPSSLFPQGRNTSSSPPAGSTGRSEERRVGKEGRARWWPAHWKKKEEREKRR